MVNIVEVRTRRQLKAFARFSEKFYRGCPYYVPSLYADEISIMDPKKNPSLADCEVRCFLAEKDGRYVGRAAGIIQKKAQRDLRQKIHPLFAVRLYRRY